MNESRDRILTEYRSAGRDRRLCMYLQLRELRSEFILIDRHQGHKGREESLAKGKRIRCFLNRAFV